MYKYFLLPLLLISSLLSAQSKKNTIDVKHCPPGTIWLRDSLYMDQTEITNFSYLEYLSWLKINDPGHYDAALPDTTVWRNESTYNEPYTQYYLRHPAYWKYPLVGVSYEQAQAFCKWRTDRVIERNHYAPGQLEYRLPSKEEWALAANARNTGIQFGYDRLVDKNNQPKIWVKESCILFFEKGNDIYEPELPIYANKAGFCHMYENVAELTNTKGIAIGGSVFNTLYECETDKQQLYSNPLATIGFRCVCVVK